MKQYLYKQVPTSWYFSGTWQTYMVKEQSLWHKVDKGTPVEYFATVFINPLTALKMLEDFVDLNRGDYRFNIVIICFALLLLNGCTA